MPDQPNTPDEQPARPEDAEAPSAPQPKYRAGGFTLDLSKGSTAKAEDAPVPRPRKRKGPAPLVQKTINLSTKPAEKPSPAQQAGPPAAAKAKSRRDKRDGRRDGRKDGNRRPSGTSLADLLDPDTLARLRGDD